MTAPRSLFPLLALANFVVGGAAIVVVGLLPAISADLDLDVAQAGWLMAVYAIVYALSSPVLVALSGRVDRAKVLVTGLALLFAGLALATAASSLAVLLASRALMAVGSGLVTPVATAVAVASSPPVERGRALAKVYGGLTLAQAFGVPAGAWAAHVLGWRWAFGAIAVIALAAALTLFRIAPRGLPAPPTSLSTLRSVLATPRLVAATSFVLFFFTGVMALFTYVAPLLDARAQIRGMGLTAILGVFGVGAVAGNALGGFLTDRLGSARTLLLLCAGEVLLMPTLTLAPLSVIGIALVVLAWSLVTWSVHVPQQARLSALDPARAPVLLALHSAAIYVGFSLGATLGGQVMVRGGDALLGPAAAIPITLAALTLGAVARMRVPVAA